MVRCFNGKAVLTEKAVSEVSCPPQRKFELPLLPLS